MSAAACVVNVDSGTFGIPGVSSELDSRKWLSSILEVVENSITKDIGMHGMHAREISAELL